MWLCTLSISSEATYYLTHINLPNYFSKSPMIITPRKLMGILLFSSYLTLSYVWLTLLWMFSSITWLTFSWLFLVSLSALSQSNSFFTFWNLDAYVPQSWIMSPFHTLHFFLLWKLICFHGISYCQFAETFQCVFSGKIFTLSSRPLHYS